MFTKLSFAEFTPAPFRTLFGHPATIFRHTSVLVAGGSFSGLSTFVCNSQPHYHCGRPQCQHCAQFCVEPHRLERILSTWCPVLGKPFSQDTSLVSTQDESAVLWSIEEKDSVTTLVQGSPELSRVSVIFVRMAPSGVAKGVSCPRLTVSIPLHEVEWPSCKQARTHRLRCGGLVTCLVARAVPPAFSGGLQHGRSLRGYGFL